jgi:hypothetical protein
MNRLFAGIVLMGVFALGAGAIGTAAQPAPTPSPTATPTMQP